MNETLSAEKSETSWLATLLRVTVFPLDVTDVGKEPSWEALVGEAPQSVEQQPRVKITLSKGPFLNGELSHGLYPDRVELIYSAKTDPSFLQTGEYPNIGSLESSLRDFLPTINKWLEGFPPIKRIALGTILIRPVGSVDEAYENLNEALSSVTVTPGTSDFMYQINRPRESRVKPGILINRLSRWNAIKYSGFLTADSKPIATTPDQFACRLETDVNTHQSFNDELPKDEVLALFEELVSYSIEIQDKGDIA